MSGVEVEVINLAEVIAGFTAAGKGMEAAALWALGQTAMAVNMQTKHNLGTYQNSANNRRDYRGHEGPYPGFPDKVTGNLQSSVYVETKRLGMTVYEATVGVGAVYARKVELGGNGSRPFAYLQPAVDTIRPQDLFTRKFRSKWKG